MILPGRRQLGPSFSPNGLLLQLPAVCLLATQERLDPRLAFLSCPIGWGTLPESIFQVQVCTSFDEEADHVLVPCQGGLMQRSRMGMKPDRVVAGWIFAGIKQRSNDRNVTKL